MKELNPANETIRKSPILRILFGISPAVIVTSTATNALVMGVATAAVLLCSNTLIAAVKDIVSDRMRMAVYALIAAMFATIAQLLLNAYMFSAYSSISVYIPLIIVSCIIIGRKDEQSGVFSSVSDALFIGVGLIAALTLLGAVREVIGTGTLFGLRLFGTEYKPMLLLALSPGALIAAGLLAGMAMKFRKKDQGDM